MGKRPKRRQNRNDDNNDPTTAETTTTTTSNKKKIASTSILDPIIDEETTDNLHFEDPFVDQYEDEDDEHEQQQQEQGSHSHASMEINDNSKPKPTTTTPTSTPQTIQSWNPLTSTPLTPGTKLEIDESAYKMHHSLTPDWPALSFDIFKRHVRGRQDSIPTFYDCRGGITGGCGGSESIDVDEVE